MKSPVLPDTPGAAPQTPRTTPVTRGLQAAATGWATNHRWLFFGLIILGILHLNYFIFEVLLTNHTLTNARAKFYPTFKTDFEGRWAADLFMQLFGAGGNQLMHGLLGLAMLALNGIILAEFLRVSCGWKRFLVASLVLTSPVFLDYFSYSVDAGYFGLGDTCVLLGVLILDRSNQTLKKTCIAFALFVLAIAFYQPKASLITTLLAFWIALSCNRPDITVRELLIRSGYAIALFAISMVGYLLTYKLTAAPRTHQRTNVNTPAEALHEIANSYGILTDLTWRFIGSFPDIVALPMGIGLIVGCVALLVASFRNSIQAGICCVLVLLTIPPCIQFSYVINSLTPLDQGRVLPGFAFSLAIFLGLAINANRWAGGLAGLATLIAFFSAGVQEGSLNSMKTLYETQAINRITDRIESELSADKDHPLIIFGDLTFPQHSYITSPNRPLRPQASNTAFPGYRHVFTINFFLGQNRIIKPTAEQVAIARQSVEERDPWPSEQSVFKLDDAIVVLLQPYSDDLSATWSAGQIRE
ncbi:MAG: glucosyltransferase domain-containing protein [Planctomycetota bacterium]